MSHTRLLSRWPDLPAVHRCFPDRWPFLLDSTTRGGALGRWSMLLRADQNSASMLAESGQGSRFLEALDHQARKEFRSQPRRLPFEGGWFVYLGYEMAGAVEPKLDLPQAPDGLPVALARRCDCALLLDHHAGSAWLTAETPELLGLAGAEVQKAQSSHVDEAPPGAIELHPDEGARFERGVRRIREYILAGDVFQVNLSRGWRGEADSALDPVAIYRRLAERNAAPFAGLARMPGGTLLSSSPERLVRVEDRQVEVRPIAGTRPRGASESQDRALSTELLAHPKERAEHIMLIDLERNDLGRICVPGSIEVNELMIVESYAHVHHIVSNIRGRMPEGLSAVDVIRAVFPGGTITGCPKVRCMEIIAELEQTGRDFYTGSMGYLGLDGRMDLNILIRSMAVRGRTLRFRTGAGIVADSRPAAELAETEAKARGLLRALEHG